LLLQDLTEFLLDKKITADLSITDKGSISVLPYEDISQADKKSVAILTGRCGGRCGAASKRAKTVLVLNAIESLKDCDLTGETANKIAKMIIGRGINRADRAKFATPGRTAAHKSQIFMLHNDRIAALCLETKEQIAEFTTATLDLRFGLCSPMD
jgi:hypothetical protein